MLFYLPLSLLIVLSVLYRNDFGLRALAIYWLLWIVGFLAVGWFEISTYYFVAIQAILALSMLVHQKVKGI